MSSHSLVTQLGYRFRLKRLLPSSLSEKSVRLLSGNLQGCDTSKSPPCPISPRDGCQEKVLPSSSVNDPVSDAGLGSKILKAPFQQVARRQPTLFPWRHSSEPLPRMDRNSPEYFEKGHLLGSNVYSSNPRFDELATAWLFLDVPLYKMLFFRAWKDDLSEQMSWAFAQGVAGILSNVYKVPYNDITSGDSHLHFDYNNDFSSTRQHSFDADSLTPKEDLETSGVLDSTEFMVEEQLRSLYESAHEFGKENLQVRLESRPTHASMYSLFVFPFLSRAGMKRNPTLKDQYQELLEIMMHSPRDAFPIYQKLIVDMQDQGFAESTVICQVLVSCDELFWVRDLSTGTIVQGYEDEKFRRVLHLVRMEMVVSTRPRQNPLMPFIMEQGNWQITDIDDHLGGNLMV